MRVTPRKQPHLHVQTRGEAHCSLVHSAAEFAKCFPLVTAPWFFPCKAGGQGFLCPLNSEDPEVREDQDYAGKGTGKETEMTG